MPADLPIVRADADALAAKVVTLAASPDGIEPGFTTTEFWLTVIAVAADFAGPHFGLAIPANERMLIAAGLVMAYGGFRTWRKTGGAAKLSAAILADLAALRVAITGK